jgi:P pilus assembly chaperone PapD
MTIDTLRKASIHFVLRAFLLLSAVSAFAQISVFPTRVMLAARERSREVTVQNPTDKSLEITAGFGYKLIRSDSVGTLRLDSMMQNDEERAKSCRNWLKCFPRKFTLAPGASQKIRIMASAPDTIADGEYWGRLVLTPVQVGAPVVAGSDTSAGIASELTMIFALDIPVVYRKGKPSTGIAIDAITTQSDSVGMVLLVDSRRIGNSAYRGTMSAIVKDASGGEVARIGSQFTNEFILRQAFRLPSLGAGEYRLELLSESVRTGSAAEAVIPASAVVKEYDLHISAANHLQLIARN